MFVWWLVFNYFDLFVSEYDNQSNKPMQQQQRLI